MSDRVNLSRRAWLKGLGAVAGAAVGTRVGAKGWVGEALAAPAGPKAAVISLYFEGGFNAIFSSADSFTGNGAFTTSSGTIAEVGNGLYVDKSTIPNLGPWALSHMAAVGCNHGTSAHPVAQIANFSDGKQSFMVQLAASMGGTAAFKAVALGTIPVTAAAGSAAGVSLQLLRTMGDASTALGLGPVDYNRPARAAAGKALANSRTMSQNTLVKNPQSTSFGKDGYDTVVDSLGKPVTAVDVAKIAQAYNTSAGGSLESMASKLAAAELMIRAGTNVISVSTTGWDSHGDSRGKVVRDKMTAEVIPSLRKFFDRISTEPELAAMNISVLLHGDFARSLPTSDHATVLSALVIGTNVKVGTTGRVAPGVTLPPNTGGPKEMWGYMGALAKIPENPFGPNPHAALLR